MFKESDAHRRILVLRHKEPQKWRSTPFFVQDRSYLCMSFLVSTYSSIYLEDILEKIFRDLDYNPFRYCELRYRY